MEMLRHLRGDNMGLRCDRRMHTKAAMHTRTHIENQVRCSQQKMGKNGTNKLRA